MPIYLIERINRDTGAAKAELAEAPLLAIAFIEQETKHGKVNESSYTNLFTSPYRDNPDMA